MITISMNSRFLSYRSAEFQDRCVPNGDWIYCSFLPYKIRPECNVPSECFDIKNLVVSDRQSNFYKFAANIFKLYKNAENECLDSAGSEKYLYLLFDFLQYYIFKEDSDYCSPDYYLNFMLSVKMLEEVSPQSYEQYVLNYKPNIPLGITDESQDEI